VRFPAKLIWNRISVFVSALACFASVDAGKRPNVVLIMADDSAFADLGCYGSEIQTLNLNTLAAEGLRFSQYGQVPLTLCLRRRLVLGAAGNPDLGRINRDQHALGQGVTSPGIFVISFNDSP